MFVLGQLFPEPGIQSGVFALSDNALTIPHLREDICNSS